MHKFKYFRPGTLKEACEFLSKYGRKAKIIAGGTDLLVQFRKDVPENSHYKYVVDLSYLSELHYIRETSSDILIGPLTTHSELASSPIILRYAPFLAEAASYVGSPQIRNRGTIAGNIVNASPAADTVPVLVALNSTLTLTSTDECRRVSIADIYVKPYETNIKPQEILTEIKFKKTAADARTVFIKLGRRNSLAISRMNIAVLVELGEHGAIVDARIAPGSVTPTPQRIKSAEAVLIGKKPDEELFKEAAKLVAEEMIKQSGIRHSTKYKKPVIQNLTIRALNRALGWM